jgi:hypothetical protein
MITDGGEMPKQQAWSPTPGQLMLLFVLSVLAAPVEYLAHEGAHYLAARRFGVPASLHFDQVDLPGIERLSDVQRLVIVAAGPAVDWIVGLAGVVLLVARFTPMRLLLAIWVARPLQFLPSLLDIYIAYLGLGGGLQGTDEATVAALLKLPPVAVIWLELAAALPLLALIVWAVPAGRRLAVLSVMSIGVLAGWAAWLALGSLLLP